jgi:hypothetical protein
MLLYKNLNFMRPRLSAFGPERTKLDLARNVLPAFDPSATLSRIIACSAVNAAGRPYEPRVKAESRTVHASAIQRALLTCINAHIDLADFVQSYRCCNECMRLQP